jgi:hypothetical protein
MKWFQRYITGDRLIGCRSSTIRIALSLLDKEKTNFVETGTTRKNYLNCPNIHERAADGCSTIIFGEYAQLFGGHVWTCDISENNIENCKIATEEYKDSITYIVDDSLNFLANFKDKIDFLYLDSVDGWDSNSHIHQLKEIEIALPKLHKNSLILLDDIGYKTNLSIPFLKQNGWCQIMIDNCPDSHNMIQALFIHEENLFDRSFIKR